MQDFVQQGHPSKATKLVDVLHVVEKVIFLWWLFPEDVEKRSYQPLT